MFKKFFSFIFGLNIEPITLAGAGVMGGTQLLGGLLGGFGEAEAARMTEEEERRRREMEQRQYGISLAQRQREYGQQAGLAGLGFLSQQVFGAQQEAKKRSFRDAILGLGRGV